MAGPSGMFYLYVPPSAFPASTEYKQSHASPDGMPSSSSLSSATDYTTYPLARRHGRTYFRDPENTYPLPCDFTEIHRQTLRSLIQMRVFGGPFCTPHLDDHPPQRVLDVACGSAHWSHTCHEHFASKGHSNVSFVGLDIVNLAPDLQKQGVNWQFKRHDLRKRKLPFPDEYFDFVFLKDTSMCPPGPETPTDGLGLLTEVLRVLKPGGVLEMWESDYIFRSLLPNPPSAPGVAKEAHDHANSTATYTISPATPFAEAQNKYLKDYNKWAQKAFDQRKLVPLPCARINLSLTSIPESLHSIGSRRIAIPLGEIKWEQKSQEGERKSLTPEQFAIRQTALMTIVQMIESLDPMLMEVSGKGKDEWDRWWTGMITDLLQKGGVTTGECLEVGAWWAKKR